MKKEEKYIEVKLKIKRTIAISNIHDYPCIENDHIIFLCFPHEKLYKALDSEQTTLLNEMIDNRKINKHVDLELTRIKLSAMYSSYSKNTMVGYTWEDISNGSKANVYAHDGHVITVKDTYDYFPYLIYRVTLPIYHK
jgi:hypothetical protein